MKIFHTLPSGAEVAIDVVKGPVLVTLSEDSKTIFIDEMSKKAHIEATPTSRGNLVQLKVTRTPHGTWQIFQDERDAINATVTTLGISYSRAWQFYQYKFRIPMEPEMAKRLAEVLLPLGWVTRVLPAPAPITQNG